MSVRTRGAVRIERQGGKASLLQRPDPATGCGSDDPRESTVCGYDPKGIRTPVAAVKGRCPRPLDDGAGVPRERTSARRRRGSICNDAGDGQMRGTVARCIFRAQSSDARALSVRRRAFLRRTSVSNAARCRVVRRGGLRRGAGWGLRRRVVRRTRGVRSLQPGRASHARGVFCGGRGAARAAGSGATCCFCAVRPDGVVCARCRGVCPLPSGKSGARGRPGAIFPPSAAPACALLGMKGRTV